MWTILIPLIVAAVVGVLAIVALLWFDKIVHFWSHTAKHFKWWNRYSE